MLTTCLAADHEFVAQFQVTHLDANYSIALSFKPYGAHTGSHCGTVFRCGAGNHHGVAGIIDQSIGIDDGTDQGVPP